MKRAEAQLVPRPSHRGRGGLVGANPEAAETWKWIAEALEGAVGLRHRFRGYRDPDMTLHAVLSSEQGLGSTV